MRKSFIYILALLIMASCQTNELTPDFEPADDTLYASMEAINATKTVMDENNNVLWSEGDQLVAFMKTTLGVKYQIKEQYVGTSTGGFSKINEPDNGDDLEAGQELDHNVVVYPHSYDVWCMKNDKNTPAQSYKLNLALPETQIYEENSFAIGAFPMVAVSEDNKLTFKNICGGLKLQLKGVDKIKSIKLEGLGNEKISGKSTVVGYVDGSAPAITMAADNKSYSHVILDCGDGVQLSETTPTTFIIAVPPVEFASGMKITVTDTDGLSRTLTNSSSNKIKRSSLLTFPVITYQQEGVFEIPEGTLTSYEILAEGGTVEIPLTTNQDYQVVIPEEAQDWISIAETKVLRNETLTLVVAENGTTEARSAEVLITATDGTTLQSIIISQEANIPIGINLSAEGTANCYIISKAGTYTFPAVKGNSLEPVENPANVEVLWESFGTANHPQIGDLIKHVLYYDGNITFSTPDIFNNGNAVIAIKDTEGKILWSWHIWCTSEGYEEHVYSNNAGTMMDRNLGATSAAPGNVGSLGLLYQWGRKDPFLGSSSKSNSIRAKHVSANGYDWNNIYSYSGSGTIEYVTAHPMTFITNNSETGNRDWFYTSDNTSNTSLWQSAKTIYDPCPTGWKVPDGNEIGAWTHAGFSNMPYNSTDEGVLFPESLCGKEAWYPAAGHIPASGGSISSVGFVGCYWSTATGSLGQNYFLSLDSDGNVNPNETTGSQALGYSVRCQKENTGGGIQPPDISAVDLSINGTANCYLISEAGTYEFPTVKGNSTTSIGTPFKAAVIWESFGTDDTPSVGDIIASCHYSEGKVTFTTPEDFHDGNALIAVFDSSNEILWSWHIWCASDGFKEHNYANGAGIMMDRNLGALSAKPGHVSALGLRYQWGRKDPFLSSSSTTEVIEPESTYTWPKEIATSYTVGNIGFATKNPTTLIDGGNRYIELTQGTSVCTSDWIYYSPSNYLWQIDKTIYDPCPSGWRVCNGGKEGVWKTAGFTTSSTNSQFNCYSPDLNGYLFDSTICGEDAWYPVLEKNFTSYASSTPINSTTYKQYYTYALSLSRYNSINSISEDARDKLSFVRCQKIE